MKTTSQLGIPLLLIPLIFDGCAGTRDSRTAKAQGTAIGAVSGGALGFLAGSLLSKDGDGAVAGSVIGATAGGAIGYAFGTSVAKRKEKHASAEEWLRQEIALTKKANDDLQAYNQTLASEITALEMRVQKANEAGSQSQIVTARNEVKKARVAAAKRSALEKQIALDTKDVLADPQAQSVAPIYSAYKGEAARLDQASTERTKLFDRLIHLEQTLP